MTRLSDRLYVLAFDHRGSFLKRFGYSSDLTPDALSRLREGKRIILDGLLRSSRTVPIHAAAMLADETFAAQLFLPEERDGLTTAVCVEASGREVFEFEYENWQRHLDALRPDLAKVLLRYNPTADGDGNLVQRTRVHTLSRYLEHVGIDLLLEVLVPPTGPQKAAWDGDPARAHPERTRLLLRGMSEIQDAGVNVSIWKVEGCADRALYEQIALQAHSARSDASCIVLGAGAPLDYVTQWLEAASTVEGFIGFAVGRSIWWDSIGDWNAGKIDAKTAASQISEAYLQSVRVFEQAHAA
jgi:myo-inositol catabolism protein IolC